MNHKERLVVQKLLVVLAAIGAAIVIIVPAVAANDFVAKLNALLESTIR
jgi:hypothetical protein